MSFHKKKKHYFNVYKNHTIFLHFIVKNNQEYQKFRKIKFYFFDVFGK